MKKLPALLVFGAVLLITAITAFIFMNSGSWFYTTILPVGIMLVGSAIGVLWLRRQQKHEQDNTGVGR